MSLDLSKLEKVRELANGSVLARCPACAEVGQDGKGEHLLIYPDGRFGCCVYPNDHVHRKRIFALAGEKAVGTIKVSVAPVKTSAQPIVSGVFGRLGRVFASSPDATRSSDASDGSSEVDPETPTARTPRTGEAKSTEDGRQELRTLRTPQYSYTCRTENEDQDVLKRIQGVGVGASEASEAAPTPTVTQPSETSGTITLKNPEPSCPRPSETSVAPASTWRERSDQSDVVDKAATLFQARHILVVPAGDPVPERFIDVLQDWPSGHTASDAVQPPDSPWLDVASSILIRDFDLDPADRSTLESWQIGLRGSPHPTAKRALALLESVKPVRWGQRDIKAGRLLPRKARSASGFKKG